MSAPVNGRGGGDPYATLDVGPAATPEEIKRAYRRLAKRFHPDRAGGDADRFARITQAYELLGDPRRRAAYDESLRVPPPRPRRPRRPVVQAGLAEMLRAALHEMGEPGLARETPPLTRRLKIMVPPGGRFAVEGLVGRLVVQPAKPTARVGRREGPNGHLDAERVARQSVEVEVTGPAAVVQGLGLEPTEAGARFPGFAGRMALRAHLHMAAAADLLAGRAGRDAPGSSMLHVQARVPRGTALDLDDVAGTVTVGDTEGELVASLGPRTLLRAGRLARARLHLAGGAMAYLTDIEGDADVHAVGEAKALLDGRLARLRARLEDNAHVEVLCPIEHLHAEVGGTAFLHVKAPVGEAHCDVHTAGYVRLQALASPLRGRRTAGGLVDIAGRQAPRAAR